MHLNPYLTFDGRCAEAFACYERWLGGKILMMARHGETPAAGQTPADWQDKIIHARMTVGDTLLMGCDAPPDRYQPIQGFAVTLGVADPAEAERVFALLAEGGTVGMPIQPTFWAQRFGMLTDRFGTPWMVNCELAQP